MKRLLTLLFIMYFSKSFPLVLLPIPDVKCYFHSTMETLEMISEVIVNQEKGVFLRFGDGDINLAEGHHDMLQNSNNQLCKEMRQAFQMDGKNVFKALPIHCEEWGTKEPNMFPGNHSSNSNLCTNLVKKMFSITKTPSSHLFSPVALHYQASYNASFCIKFLRIFKDTPCIFVGNHQVPKEMVELLFGKNTPHIYTPSEQSYNDINRIEQETLATAKKIKSYKVIITAMGCSGRVLQKRLWNRLDNVYFFDFGSLLDALCGRETREWIKISGFDPAAFTEQLIKESDYFDQE